MLSAPPTNAPGVSPRPGFTLIELLAVIAVIGILAAIALPMIGGVNESTRRKQAEAEMASIAASLEAYKARYGDYPWITSTSGSPGNHVDATPGSASDTPTIATGGSKDNSTGYDLAEVDLINALTGKQGPKGDIISYKTTTTNAQTGSRTANQTVTGGDAFMDFTKFTLLDTDANASRNPLRLPNLTTTAAPRVVNCFVDPWGSPYVYVYKRTANLNAQKDWEQTGFILYSMGPDGIHDLPDQDTGAVTTTSDANKDNIYLAR